jgi:hypothetical protein
MNQKRLFSFEDKIIDDSSDDAKHYRADDPDYLICRVHPLLNRQNIIYYPNGTR